MRTSVSLAVRAALALSLWIGFYVLALGLAALFVYIPYAELVHLHRVSPKLALGCLALAFMILRGCIFVKTTPFQAPGPELHEADQPKLFAMIREIAARMNTRMPRHVYVAPDVNAFVAEIGGYMGFGTTRVMGIGMGLLHVDDVSQLRATLAHEFGHYAGGDTHLGGVIYKTRAAIGSVLVSLGDSWVSKPFELYAKLYLRVTTALSRHQGFEADRASVAIAGCDAHVSGLAAETRAGVLFNAFVHGELAPLVTDGLRPASIYESFQEFLAETKTRGMHDKVDADLAERATDPFDTHPAHADRVAFARALPAAHVPRDERPATSILRNPSAVEESVASYIFNDLGATGALRRIAWDEAAARVYAPKMAEEARQIAERLNATLGGGAAATYESTVQALVAAMGAQRWVALAKLIEPRLEGAPDAIAEELAPKVLGRSVGILAAAALVARGGRWKTSLGAPLSVEIDGQSLDVLARAHEAVEAKGTLPALLPALGLG